MLDRASALTLLNNFETYLKSITFIQSENNDVFKSYYVLKSILMKEPYEKTALIDFFADYRKKKESNIFKVSSTFSKPQNYNEKNITFLTETENYSLYDGIQLKNDYNFVISFQKIRSFYVDPNYSSFYHCIAFAHLEFLIKTKDLQKLQIYYKKFLKSNKSNYDFNTEKEELKMILTTSLLKIINLIDNPVYSEKTIISELVAMVNVFPSKFLDSLVILIKNLISEFINDEQTLNLHRFFLTPTEKNQLLTILELDMEYNITTLLKQICSSTLNINLIILNINPNHEPFQEIVTNNNPDIQRSNNLNLIYFGGSKHNYTIGYFPEENSFNMNKNNAMQTKKDNLNEENKKIEIICPKESISSSYTPKMNFKADSSENIFEFLSIPSERKNSFKLNYEKYVNSGQKPLSKEKVINN